MKKRAYEDRLAELQVEIAQLQRWVKHSGMRVVVVFEGRDTAGKGGMIKAITAKASARVFKVTALPAPNDRERTQLYLQRYIAHMPAAGEVVLFDRSWYNRAGVEPVMGFCTAEESERFLRDVPQFEEWLIRSGIVLLKYWLEVSPDEQAERLQERIDDPVKRWKLSNMDIEGRKRWFAYSRARDRMFAATDTKVSPWFVVPSDDQRAARLNCIAHMLDHLPYEVLSTPAVTLPEREMDDAYNDDRFLQQSKTVPQKYS